MAIALRYVDVAAAPETPNRESLRRELMMLREQYQRDRDCADELIAGYERMIWCARGERNLAINNLNSLDQLLSIEFPGWNELYEDVPA